MRSTFELQHSRAEALTAYASTLLQEKVCDSQQDSCINYSIKRGLILTDSHILLKVIIIYLCLMALWANDFYLESLNQSM